MTPLPTHGIYLITDGKRPDLVDAVGAAIAGGAAVVQYRDLTQDTGRRLEEARALARACALGHVPLIIDHDIALAEAVAADGVHFSQSDGDPSHARHVLGPEAIVGISCYASENLARAAADAGASYVSFGAFFPSPTKPDAGRAPLELLRQTRALPIPRVAIGGITPDNGGLLVDAGADFLAVVSAVFGHADTRMAAAAMASLYPSQPDHP